MSDASAGPLVAVDLLLLMGGVSASAYAFWRTAVHVFFPHLWTSTWQQLTGPWVRRFWPAAVQNADPTRGSYLGDGDRSPHVQRPLQWPASELTAGWIRDGLVIGVTYAVVPPVLWSVLMALWLPMIIIVSFAPVARTAGPARIDAIAHGLERCLAFVGGLWLIDGCGRVLVAA